MGEIEEAIGVLKAGGVVAYPTESFYGLGADPRNPAAVRRLFEIKGRELKKAILLVISSVEVVREYARDVTEVALELMERHWPGPLTLVLWARPWVSELLHGGTHKIGLRLSLYPVAKALAEGIGGAITGTSCNISGLSPCVDSSGVMEQLGDKVDFVIKDPVIPCSNVPSTILDVTMNPPVVLREGAIKDLTRFALANS